VPSSAVIGPTESDGRAWRAVANQRAPPSVSEAGIGRRPRNKGGNAAKICARKGTFALANLPIQARR